MRRANRHLEEEMPGQDSFLDIVANIVGILILLVMVMGVRASYDPQIAAKDSEEASTPNVSEKELHQAYRTAADARTEVHTMVHQVVRARYETLHREEERVQLNTIVAAMEEVLEERRGALGVQQQRDFDLRRQLLDAQQTLDDLTREQISQLSQAPEVEEVESLPTPLAQTVSGQEVHLRLAAGHVAFVPLEDLLAEFKTHAENNLWRLADQSSMVHTVGPVAGFRLRYRLRKRRFETQSQAGSRQGARQGTLIQLVRWELLPTKPTQGEPVEQALLPNSDLLHYMKHYPPEATTVTIWTYPNSFDEFRMLKQALFDWGYATAGRPLPEGILIGGSPNGSKSVAQ